MTFYLIGLGLDVKSMSISALEAIKKCDEVYVENYTVDFPYSQKEIERIIGKKIVSMKREKVESEELVDKAKNKNLALLVYGDPLSATTHIQLILHAKKKKIPYKIIHSDSVLTAVAETGLQLYKFGRTASMPKFSKNYEPESFFDIIMNNEKIKAHTLLLTDIGLTSKQALEQLDKICKKKNFHIEKIVICSRIGTKHSKIYYDKPEKLKKKYIKMPFCIIIPSELHFAEKEALEVLKEKI